jgi:hypothetical protein
MFIELHKKFQKSIISREPRFTRTVLRSELQGNIFRHVPYFLAEEVRRVEVQMFVNVNNGVGVRATSLFKSVREGKSISLTYIYCHLVDVAI